MNTLRFEDHPWVKSDSELFNMVASAVEDHEQGVTNPLENLKMYKNRFGKPRSPIKDLAEEWMEAVYDVASGDYDTSVLIELYHDLLTRLQAINELSNEQKQKMQDWFTSHNLAGGRRVRRRRATRKSRKSRKSRRRVRR
jgi:hypothetical protein